MISAACEACRKETSYPDVFHGQRLRCKNCPDGWVTMPPNAGNVQSPNLSPPAPLPAALVSSPIPVSNPLPEAKQQYHPTTDAEREILRRAEAAASKPYEDPNGHIQVMRSSFFVIAFIGFGSLVLRIFGVQFRIMNGMEAAQPYAGFTVGCIGLALLYWWQNQYGD